ncbi:MAG: hypothetical protein ACR2OB_00900 [Solirubrobacteraceae bacterium]
MQSSHAPDSADQQADLAAAEAGAIGGRASSVQPPDADQAQRPLIEAGQGESEGLEEAERELVEHATHGDQHAARRVIEDAPATEEAEEPRGGGGGEADREHSSERDDER